MDEILFSSASALTARIQSGLLSAREVMEEHLLRIEEVNPSLNAIVTLDPERAMAGSAAADDRFAKGESVGVLHGLPIAHKDLVSTAGMRTTLGSPLFADHVPDADGLIAERYRDAGAILIGKTNTPEFGAGSHTFNPVFGSTRNPYDATRICGGSSGGAAVALATGMLPIADGSDMGGSLRNPAAYCNVVGFRPSPGRVPSWPKTAAWSVMSTEGPMARTVGDIALQMRAITGHDPRSPIALEVAGDPFDIDFRSEVRPVRVAWSDTLGGLPIDPAITEGLKTARGVMEDLGWQVDEAEPDLTDAREIFQVYRAWQYEVLAGQLYDEHGDRLKDTVRWNIEEARRRPLTDHTTAARKLEALYQRVRVFFEDYDVLACPVTQVPPFPVEVDWPRRINGVEMETYIDWMRVCTDISVTGCPSISVPGGFTQDGLPVGLQLVGPQRGDVGLLKIAGAFEAASRVGERRPPL